ncbi:hypothetical protein [Thalassospira sp.]|uniref:hypothetical protein n=1 Tax=Thalassospira sp. TaxID=1912094 RepID=UPI0032F025CF
MDNVVDIQNGRIIKSSGAGNVESPMRFWKGSASTATKQKPDQDGSSNVSLGTEALENYGGFQSLLKVALKQKPSERAKNLRFLARIFIYYPLRDFIFKKIGNAQVKRLVSLSLKLNRPDFRIDITQSHDHRISVCLDSLEFSKGGATSMEILSGILPGHDPYLALTPFDMRDTMKRLIHLSKLTDIGVLGPAE